MCKTMCGGCKLKVVELVAHHENAYYSIKLHMQPAHTFTSHLLPPSYLSSDYPFVLTQLVFTFKWISQMSHQAWENF